MLRKLILILLVCLISGKGLAFSDDQIMEIGIFRNKSLYSVIFKPADNTYRIYDKNDSMIYHLQKFESVTIKVNSDKSITVKVPDETIGTFDEVSIQSFSSDSHYAIKGSNPSTKERKYFGGIKCFSMSGKLDVVSLVTMQHYLEGVLESEAGNYQSKEYYKVQAIISRTYAMKNQNKFKHEGFMMTDLTNCQVYLGNMYRNPAIEEAVKETESLVLVDEQMKLISAAFYSNSGGQTSSSEYVWSNKVSYLRSVHDPFSKGKFNYKWSKSFNKDQFLKDLEKRYDFPVDDTTAINELFSWKQENRAKYFVDWKYHILLTDVRMDFGLKSTFFEVIDEGEKVRIEGKGFGHGVGLSQEGSMNMCDMGYSFKDVLQFYYTGVHLIDYRMLSFYLSE